MEVRLTDKGLTLFGFSASRRIQSVSDNRAFVLMTGGYAVPDKSYMEAYKLNNPEPKKEAPGKITVTPKETATSKKAKKREKRSAK